MNVDNLNFKKATFSLVGLVALVLFIISVQIGNGIFLSLIVSLVAALPITWLLIGALAAIYEVLKLFKPLVNWFFK